MGHARWPPRGTPSGRCAPLWTWWPRWPQLGAETGVPGLAARAGVVTGEVAVTLGAVGEGMVAGDAVNTAARVQAAAEPGQVLVDAATQRLAGAAVGFADAGRAPAEGQGRAAAAVAGDPGAGGSGRCRSGSMGWRRR